MKASSLFRNSATKTMSLSLALALVFSLAVVSGTLHGTSLLMGLESLIPNSLPAVAGDYAGAVVLNLC